MTLIRTWRDTCTYPRARKPLGRRAAGRDAAAWLMRKSSKLGRGRRNGRIQGEYMITPQHRRAWNTSDEAARAGHTLKLSGTETNVVAHYLGYTHPLTAREYPVPPFPVVISKDSPTIARRSIAR